jgi:hypothetical protein
LEDALIATEELVNAEPEDSDKRKQLEAKSEDTRYVGPGPAPALRCAVPQAVLLSCSEVLSRCAVHCVMCGVVWCVDGDGVVWCGVMCCVAVCSVKMRGVRDVARDTIRLMERLHISHTLPAALDFLAQYEELDAEEDAENQAAEDEDNEDDEAAQDGSPSKSKRKKQKTSAEAFTFEVNKGLPLTVSREDEPRPAALSGALAVPAPAGVQLLLVPSPSHGSQTNADFKTEIDPAGQCAVLCCAVLCCAVLC